MGPGREASGRPPPPMKPATNRARKPDSEPILAPQTRPHRNSSLTLRGAFTLFALLLFSASACSLVRPSGPTLAAGRAQVGSASWYGKRYQGKRTASGERFDEYAMTAAHPTLPFGTRLRVTNLENRRSAIVRVNDRGPFVDGRVIDLSLAAARELGIAEEGVARVRLQRLN
jgi:rare lipoprotein A